MSIQEIDGRVKKYNLRVPTLSYTKMRTVMIDKSGPSSKKLVINQRAFIFIQNPSLKQIIKCIELSLV